MAISPIPVRPAPPQSPGAETRRARIVALLVAIGIAAALVAYAASPAVRHAVGHAAHSVKHAVGRVLDRDAAKRKPAPAAPHTSSAGRSQSGTVTSTH
jgi:hypothetical protein